MSINLKIPDIRELKPRITVFGTGGAGGNAVNNMIVSGLQGAPGEPRHSVLSEREFQIFCKLAEGKSVSEIAAKLFLSVKTVSTYRTRILEKMAMKTNADITYYAIKNNLLQ